ncbi:beta-N-acetylhexosaminidase [Chondromyces apiculatus]|uniref:Beta-hexosaminidase n=1 Tax=Chondromyces apiculatus DSM 436 TaxID=1192034 RepID=A0A017T353_9BACT|nr:beta-N-acetylhexosaminidase [Chondromyces apiculatus]EYF03669.1 Beta-hexosaminidase [Chondromyces apiculatus DSM 436]
MPDLDLPTLCGQLVVGGFRSVEPPARFLDALSRGYLGGAILFRRNLPDLPTASRTCRALAAAQPGGVPPFIGLDQEGGRVARLPVPFLKLPPARALGLTGDVALIRRAARAVADELRALGVNVNFAPVLDVDSNPQNPVIGDRSFARDPGWASAAAVAFLEGQQEGGVLACGKHFPGHGDTDTDSHLALPRIPHDRPRLDAVELPPFRAAASAKVASMMTAHVVVESLDPGVPATLSRVICTDLLRGEVGFEGVLFSDDLEMAAVAALHPVEESATRAIAAGCDVVLVCSDEDAQARAHAALVARAERDEAFRARCAEAASRCLSARRRCPPEPLDEASLRAVLDRTEGRALLEAIAAAGAAAAAASAQAGQGIDPTEHGREVGA